MQINNETIAKEVTVALLEDIGSGDVSASLLPPDLMVRAKIFAREPMLMCGQPWVNHVFSQVNADVQVDWCVQEGAWLAEPRLLCYVTGNARAILTAERTALNFLQTLAGTATQTYQYVQKLQGYATKLLDTRKTIPGLRLAQKYAVLCAGGVNHRFGLYDAYLIKENHIKACGSIRAAITNAKKARQDLFIEVEVETLDELREALTCQPDRILLDNFSLDQLVQAVSMNQPKCCALEASGGVCLDTIEEIAKTGVDYISVGAMTKSVQAIDLSLLIEE